MVYLVLLALLFCFNRLLFTNFFRILTAVDELTPSNPIISFLVTAPCNRAYSNTFSPLALVCTPSELFTNGSEGSTELLPFLYFALIFGSMILKAFFEVSPLSDSGKSSSKKDFGGWPGCWYPRPAPKIKYEDFDAAGWNHHNDWKPHTSHRPAQRSYRSADLWP